MKILSIIIGTILACNIFISCQTKLQSKSIGSATMLEDGTIILDLRAEHEGIIGDAQLSYPPSHPQYSEILSHIGKLRPGESKQVPPWPNSEDPNSESQSK